MNVEKLLQHTQERKGGLRASKHVDNIKNLTQSELPLCVDVCVCLCVWPSVTHSVCGHVYITARMTLTPPVQPRSHSSHASWTFQAPAPALRPEVPQITDSTFFFFLKSIFVQNPSLSAHTHIGVQLRNMLEIQIRFFVFFSAGEQISLQLAKTQADSTNV